MGNGIKWLLKEEGGRIFKSYDISLKYAHLTRLDHLCTHAVILQCLFCHVLAYAISVYGVCLHLLVPCLAQYNGGSRGGSMGSMEPPL